MKKRFSVLFGISLAVLVGVLIVAGAALEPQKALAQAPKPITLKVQASWPAGSLLFVNLKMFVERVAKMSGGRLKIEALPGGAIVGPFEVLDATSRGVIDGAHTAPAYWAGKSKAAFLMQGPPGGPFGMDHIDFVGWYFNGGGAELFREWYQDVLKMNVVPLGPAVAPGPQSLGWFKKPIRSWEDLRGLKFRAGTAAELFKEAGMTVITVPGGEVLPAGERGVIDAAEWVSPGEDIKLGFHTVWKYHVTPSIHENSTTTDFFVNKDVWAKLPADLQEIVRSAVLETYLLWWTKLQWEDAVAMRELTEKHGVRILRTPDDVLIKFLQAWDKLAERDAAKDPFFKKVYESQKKYASMVVPSRRLQFPPYKFIADFYWPEKK